MFSKCNLYLNMQVNRSTELFGHANPKKKFLRKTVVIGLVLSHVLMPLSHAGVTIRQLDNPDGHFAGHLVIFFRS